MVLADYSGALPEMAGHQPEQRSVRRPVAAAALAALALSCVAAVVVFSVSNAGGRVALKGHRDILDAAMNAEQTLNEGITKLGRGAQSLQKASLSAEMNQALAAVKELKGNLPSDEAADAAYTGASALIKGSRRRVARLQAKHADVYDVVHKSLSKVRVAAAHAKTDSAVVGDLQDKDNRLVRDELRKLLEVAKRLSGEIKAMPNSSKRAAARVQRKLGAVAQAATAMNKAAGEEDTARQRVVAHELEVRKQKLAEAEEEEMAAARAAKEAVAAERLAMKKHREAAADEAAAHQRRVAARRARAIAARGQEGKRPMVKADEAADSVFPKMAKVDEWKKLPVPKSKEAIESECTITIATHGCGGLMAENPCLAYCGTDNDVRRAARSRRSGGPIQTGFSVHERTGYFATGKDRDSYVDSVYGDSYDPSTYTHERTGYFVSKQSRSSLLAPEVSKGGFPDVAADGQDYHSEQSSEDVGSAQGSAQQVLRNEEALKRRLTGSLEQEQAQNNQLKQRLIQQESALRCGCVCVCGVGLDLSSLLCRVFSQRAAVAVPSPLSLAPRSRGLAISHPFPPPCYSPLSHLFLSSAHLSLTTLPVSK